jgi:hypothetical protein
MCARCINLATTFWLAVARRLIASAAAVTETARDIRHSLLPLVSPPE